MAHKPFAKLACLLKKKKKKKFPLDVPSKDDIFKRQERLQEVQRLRSRKRGRMALAFALEDKVTVLARGPFSIPLVAMNNKMRPEYKSQGHDPVEKILTFRSLEVPELAHVTVMCGRLCQMHGNSRD